MKKQTTFRKTIEKVWKNRAAIVIAIAATVFMCGLTALEFVALRMEWNLPVLAYVTGDSDSYIFEEYRSDEMKLDDSTENVLLEEDMRQGKSQSQDDRQEDITQGESQSRDDRQEDITQSESQSEKSGKDAVQGESQSENRQEDVSQKENTQEKDSQQSASDETEFPYYIKINRKQNCITVYTSDENGEYTVPYKAMICSTGLYNATPRGTFHLSTKYLWRELYGKVYGQYATRITGGVLFHSVPYYKKSKSALCTEKYNKLGQQASMGCVRLTVEDAKWIADNCPSGTTVEIYDDDDPGPLGKPEAAHIDTDSPNKGWDPTDPDVENPWHQLSDDE
ncbi:L,D-transpeptidase family protein [Roseburia inulinivorans]|uniref:L,D-transpeptidase family protein n=1 Tax=Roseburia inulinivorans TaxID=360807 RepID=UPI003FEDF091